MEENHLEPKAFTQHRGSRLNGFYLKFPNGNSVSTIWSRGSYSDNQDFEIMDDQGNLIKEKLNCPLASDTCEAMVDCPDLMVELFDEKFSGGNPYCHLTILQWLEMLNILAKDYK